MTRGAATGGAGAAGGLAPALLLLLALAPTGCRAQPSGDNAGSSPPASCPKGSSYADGCAAAPGRATVQHQTFFTGYANQSGQSNYAYRPPWNVAGVDYPVGMYTAQGSLTDPTVSPPAGCSWNAGANTVECTGTGSLTIHGYDFSLHNGVRLRIQSNYTGACTIEDSYFKTGSASDAAAADLIRIDGGTTCSFVFQSNTMDMDGANFIQLATGINDLRVSPATTLYQYNAFLNTPSEWINGGSGGAYLNRYNYAEAYQQASGQHGEYDLAPGAGQIVASMVFSYNTMMQPAVVATGGAGTTTQIYYTEGGGHPTTYSTGSIDHNVLVVNTKNGVHPGGFASISAAAFEAGGATYGTIAVTANYIDPTGALSCFYQDPRSGTWTWSGNVNMLNGEAENAFNAPCTGKASH